MAKRRQPARRPSGAQQPAQQAAAPAPPPGPPPSPPPILPPRLDEQTLRRFVFQTFGRSRRTQDSPIVPDVWMRYIGIAEDVARAQISNGRAPAGTLDLLLTPLSGTGPGAIAQQLRERMQTGGRWPRARIAQSTSRVVASIDFPTLVRDVVPLTVWWQDLARDQSRFETIFQRFYEALEENLSISLALSRMGRDIEFFRYAALVGFIDRLMNATSAAEVDHLKALALRLGAPLPGEAFEGDAAAQGGELRVSELEILLDGYEHATGGRVAVSNAAPTAMPAHPGASDLKGIDRITVNRPASQSLFESRNTVKADAAQRVFDISTAGLAFAVIDGGIDATHPAFLKRSEPELDKDRFEDILAVAHADLERWSRVVATYDFTILRDIISSAGDPQLAPAASRAVIARLAADRKNDPAFASLKVRNDLARDIDWGIVAPLMQVAHDQDYVSPGSDHGTHVSGILAANLPKPADAERALAGMCPDLSLYDLRVFNAEGHGDEFAILCAIEFVGWLNRDRAHPVVHGVNMSLALAHDVDSFACGQTPICEACNHLVGAGTVVVAAAGNSGFDGPGAIKQSLGTGYRAISITDPGNADGVITVGSTHRRDPHAYGVSYFSARGPTGDGRRKPDLLAPGEKITSTIRGGLSQRMDGTSMAAPHVSGAAALLMARYPELIGHPYRIKQILMQSATDLQREPSFQGAGLLDVLRALQSV